MFRPGSGRDCNLFGPGSEHTKREVRGAKAAATTLGEGPPALRKARREPLMMDTGRLIEHLVDADGPVRPLARPWRRTAGWLAIALPYVALVVLVVSPR